MRVLQYIFIVIFLLVCKDVASQHNKHLLRGDAYYDIGQYYNAIKYYKYGHRKHSDGYALYKLIKCYAKTNQPEELFQCYRKLVEENSNYLDSSYVLYLGALRKKGEYERAKGLAYNIMNKVVVNKKQYESILISCDSAIQWAAMNSDNEYFVENIKHINTEFSEISPAFHRNTVVFASNREDTFIKNKPGEEELPYYDLYTCDYDPMHFTFSKSGTFSSVINTGTHESSASFSEDGSKVYFTQHVNHMENSVSSIARMKLFYMEKVDNHWDNSHTFVFNDSTFSFAHPFINRKGNLFFFVSDMKNGIGGTDIYFCAYDSLRNGWSNPVNIGPPFNTPGNEVFPFYDDATNKLYFASDEHPGLGGYDIFEAVLTDENPRIINLKYPINSSYDDFCFTINIDEKFGFFSSNRPGGMGKEDIYLFIRQKYNGRR